MTYTLHGYPGTIVFLLAILGGMHILTGIENWLRERISLDLHPLWHVIPRRFKVSVRWDRPWAMVSLPDGGEGRILSVYECDDQPCPVALVQPYDPEDDPHNQRPEWMSADLLSPLPGHSFRETVRAMRGREDESA